MLLVGNSFTGDAFYYAPFIINAVAPQAQVEMGILYRSGCSLKQHYDDGVGSGRAGCGRTGEIREKGVPDKRGHALVARKVERHNS